jgi:hypothetical protein
LFGAVEADPLDALAVDLDPKAFQLFLGALAVWRTGWANRIMLAFRVAIQGDGAVGAKRDG